MRKRIFITGLGAVSAVGANIDLHKNSMINSITGIKKYYNNIIGDIKLGIIKSLDDSELIGFGYIFNPIEKKTDTNSYSDRTIKIAEKAAYEAVVSADLVNSIENRELDRKRVAVIISSSKNGINSILKFAHLYQDIQDTNEYAAEIFKNCFGDKVSLSIAKKYGFEGPCLNYPAACATGGVSISMAANIILDDVADVVIAGSVDSSLHPLLISGFRNMGVLSKSLMVPFSKNRDGFNIGEGAGVVVLESEESVRRRKMKILAELSGWDFASDAYHNVRFKKGGESVYLSLQRLFSKFNLCVDDVSYINAHGTATSENDIFEYNGIESFFKNALSKIPVSSTKPLTGHLLGGASSIEAVFTILALMNKHIPPTINLINQDENINLMRIPECGLKIYKPKTGLSLSYGFGGHISILAFKV